MSKALITDIVEAEIDTVLADDIDFTGVLKFSKSLMIKGKFEGEIEAEGHLVLSEGAFVKATIKVNKLTCFGKIEGNIFAKERVELSKTSSVTGDIQTPDFIIESGCSFNGNCSMGKNAPSKPAQPQQNIDKNQKK